MNSRAKIIFGVAGLLCSASVLCQTFTTRSFGDDKGLAQKFIFSISQDTNGLLLLATENGLTTFNGDHFAEVAAPASREKQAAYVLGDKHGQTWIGHFQSGLMCMRNGKTYVIDSSESVSGRISTLSEDSRGNIWGISEGHGVFRIEAGSHFLTFPTGGDGINGQLICVGSDIVIGTDQGAIVYETDGKKLVVKKTLNETQGKSVSAFASGQIGGLQYLFMSSPGNGIYVYDITNGAYGFHAAYSSDLQCREMEISSLTLDRSANLWIGTIGEGLRRIAFDDNGIPQHIDAYRHDDGLVDDNIKSLFTDAENNVWVGTFGSGLVEIPFSVFQFYDEANGLFRKEVNCVAEDRLGILWLGTDNGITRFCISESRSGHTNSCAAHFGAGNGFADVAVSCMVADTSGMIWIGTAENGIYRLNPFTYVFENISEKYGLQSKMINTLTLTRNNDVIAGTTEGAYVFNHATTEVKFLTTMEGLLHNDVRNLYTDHANSVWFSSEGTPPYAMHDEQFYVFHKIDQLRGFMITGVCEDEQGTRWITTSGDGVFSFDGVNFHQFTEHDGLKSDNCIASVAEDNGNLWVVHKSGLSMKYPDDRLFHNFSSTDIEYLREFNSQVFKAHNGNIYFCSDDGLIELPERRSEAFQRYPKVSLANVMVNGAHSDATDHLDLGAGTYNLTFEYNSILLSSPGFNKFYYRISGADSAWRESRDRNIVIPKLGAGDYVLQVTGESPWGVTPKLIHDFRIHIDYPFWEQSWFIVTMLMAGPIILLISIRLRTMQLTRINKRLHVLVKEKTHLLETEKESVARMNVELKAKTKDITDSIHYAMRIQMAILPDLGILRKVFPESFVYYKPRDIVSGDFYWFAEKDDQLIMAVVDCTGHGVPGALMSMIGTTLINKVVFDFRVTSPSGILEFLNREIRTALHQNDSIDSSHDGMDIAVCIYDKRSRTLRFAGAGRPLIRVKDGRSFLYKTNQGGLGGVYSNRIQLFNEIDFNAEPGDAFYMYSDGFTDQFGSEGRRKYSTAHFRTLVQEMAEFPMQQQESILAEEFDNWRGDAEQFDDVLVVGFRIPGDAV